MSLNLQGHLGNRVGDQSYLYGNQYQQQVMPKQQTTTIIDPKILQQADNIDVADKFEQPVMPCIIDPGPYDLSWLADPGENIDDIANTTYLTMDEIKSTIAKKNEVDQLYLVKWRGLSYTQCTWEPESIIKNLFDDKIQDYMRFNRSLDQF
jgi:hypothetical protein